MTAHTTGATGGRTRAAGATIAAIGDQRQQARATAGTTGATDTGISATVRTRATIARCTPDGQEPGVAARTTGASSTGQGRRRTTGATIATIADQQSARAARTTGTTGGQ